MVTTVAAAVAASAAAAAAVSRQVSVHLPVILVALQELTLNEVLDALLDVCRHKHRQAAAGVSITLC
jgi:hypothetical protein